MEQGVWQEIEQLYQKFQKLGQRISLVGKLSFKRIA